MCVVVCGWVWCVLFLALSCTSSSSNVFKSLSDLDFHRIRADHFLATADQHQQQQQQQQQQGGSASSSSITLSSLTRQLLGEGYHRELRTNIVVQGTFFDTKILVAENITRDMYMDLDQVKGLV